MQIRPNPAHSCIGPARHGILNRETIPESVPALQPPAQPRAKSERILESRLLSSNRNAGSERPLSRLLCRGTRRIFAFGRDLASTPAAPRALGRACPPRGRTKPFLHRGRFAGCSLPGRRSRPHRAAGRSFRRPALLAVQSRHRNRPGAKGDGRRPTPRRHLLACHGGPRLRRDQFGRISRRPRTGHADLRQGSRIRAARRPHRLR